MNFLVNLVFCWTLYSDIPGGRFVVDVGLVDVGLVDVGLADVGLADVGLVDVGHVVAVDLALAVVEFD